MTGLIVRMDMQMRNPDSICKQGRTLRWVDGLAGGRSAPRSFVLMIVRQAIVWLIGRVWLMALVY